MAIDCLVMLIRRGGKASSDVLIFYFTQRSEAAVCHQVDSVEDLGCGLEKKCCKTKKCRAGRKYRGKGLRIVEDEGDAAQS